MNQNELKQLTSLILPVTALIIIPLTIETDTSIKYRPALVIGLLLIIIGLFILKQTIQNFSLVGKGTLAPWYPTKKLITLGMYRYVRNPMIIGVLTVLAGESISVMSLKILIWASIFFLIYNVFLIFFEEPDLTKKFGNEYIDYKIHVPRWIPRLKPYCQNTQINQRRDI